MAHAPKKLLPRAIRLAMLLFRGLYPFFYRIRHLFRNFNLIKGPAAYVRDYFVYWQLPEDPRFPLKFSNSKPCMYDRYSDAALKSSNHFRQNVWAARKVYESTTPIHYDLGSHVEGFVSMCAVFCRVNVFDMRTLPSIDKNIHFIQADFANLGSTPSGTIHSLSSLHVFEHVGLGRYGDPIGVGRLDLAANEVKRVLAPGGNFYVVVPIGVQRLKFNAHRVFAVRTVLELFDGLELVEFSGIDDADNLHLDTNPRAFEKSLYSCGLFHFRKPLA